MSDTTPAPVDETAGFEDLETFPQDEDRDEVAGVHVGIDDHGAGTRRRRRAGRRRGRRNGGRVGRWGRGRARAEQDEEGRENPAGARRWLPALLRPCLIRLHAGPARQGMFFIISWVIGIMFVLR